MAEPQAFLKGRVTVHAGDCREVLKNLDENSIDSCVCDPPYHLASIVKRFGKLGSAEAQFGSDGAYRRAAAGFMGKAWDGGDVAFRPETWSEVLRVLKPGAHLVAFGGTRTYHRLACAIEDAGFEIRDAIMWHYGSGFPKSHDVSKGIDRAAGVTRSEIVGSKLGRPGMSKDGSNQRNGFDHAFGGEMAGEMATYILAPATPSARQWEGWGTSLKPATEILVLARKPLSEGTIAANVLRWGTGAINIRACRIPGTFESGWSKSGSKASENVAMSGANYERDPTPDNAVGRWPANVIHDGSEEVLAAFPETTSGTFNGNRNADKFRSTYGDFKGTPERETPFEGSTGSAARFFYTAKADSDDRIGSKHPTVKPLDLIQYLVRLVTPPKGLVLDCFAGTGTTGEAAWREGFSAVLIEREAEYLADIERRMSLCLAGPDERARESIKARLKGKPEDHGPLFEGAAA